VRKTKKVTDKKVSAHREGKEVQTSEQYLHGYTKKEQNRLLNQAKFLEPYVYPGVDLEFRHDLLEVGCGVGAQTKILTRRFPELKITGVDLSDTQISMAKKVLAKEIQQERVKLLVGNAQKLALGKKFDSAFLCWFLEHVPDPLQVLKKVFTHLKPGAKIYCTEVFNQTLFVEPYSPAYLKYWFEFNDYQWNIKGHPFIGGQLGNLLKDAGFSEIRLEFRPLHFDSREPERRAAFVEYFYQILLSAKDSLLQAGRVSPDDLKAMEKEVDRMKKDKNAVFYYSFVRATARRPY
jgi:SAM-dependent methyltransferase